MINSIQEKFIIRMIINGVRDEIIADDRGISLQDVKEIKSRNKDYIIAEKNKRIADSVNENSKNSWKSNEIERNKSIINRLIELGYVGKKINYEEFKKLYEEFGMQMGETKFGVTILGVSSTSLRMFRLENWHITILGMYKKKNDKGSKDIKKKYRGEKRESYMRNPQNTQTSEDTFDLTKVPKLMDVSLEENSIEENNLLYSTMRNPELYKIRQDIVMGREYDKEVLKRLLNDTKSDSLLEKDKASIEAVVDIYLQLNQFDEAENFVNSIYDEDKEKEPILKIIKSQETIYNVMKAHKKGIKIEEIAQNLGLNDLEIKKIINRQKRLDELIMHLYSSGTDTEVIINRFNINIQRINDVLSSKSVKLSKLTPAFSEGPEWR